jgi:hypothetical protein
LKAAVREVTASGCPESRLHALAIQYDGRGISGPGLTWTPRDDGLTILTYHDSKKTECSIGSDALVLEVDVAHKVASPNNLAHIMAQAPLGVFPLSRYPGFEPTNHVGRIQQSDILKRCSAKEQLE